MHASGLRKTVNLFIIILFECINSHLIIMMNLSQSHSQAKLNTQHPIQYISEYDNHGYANSHNSQQSNQKLIGSQTREGYHMANYHNPNAISRVKSETNRFVSSQVRSEEVVKGQSRVSYVPYEKKVVEYQDRTYIQKVPVKRKVIQYEERRVMQTVPREVVKQDYYAVEKRIQYLKEVIPEKKIEMVPVERKVKRYEYVPVEKQIVHYPENVDLQTAKNQSRVVLGQQGVAIKSDAEYRKINPTLIYNYSNRPQSKNNPIGYVDQGQSRVFSNAPTFMQDHQFVNHQISSHNVQSHQPNSISRPQYGEQDNYQLFLQPPQHQYPPQQLYPQPRTQSLGKPIDFRQINRQEEGQSYIKELNHLNHGLAMSRQGIELKQPFRNIEQKTGQQRVMQARFQYREEKNEQNIEQQNPHEVRHQSRPYNFSIQGYDWQAIQK